LGEVVDLVVLDAEGADDRTCPRRMLEGGLLRASGHADETEQLNRVRPEVQDDIGRCVADRSKASLAQRTRQDTDPRVAGPAERPEGEDDEDPSK
jgi:hypothetical protein